MRAFDPEMFNNNGNYRLVDRIKKACEGNDIKAYLHNHWIMLPSKADADVLAEEVMKSLHDEYGQNITVVITGNVLWELCALEDEE